MKNPWIARAGLALAPIIFFGSLSFAKSAPSRLPFGPGERFEYDLKALGTSAGRLKVGVIDQGEFEGKHLMSLAAKLEPTGIATLFWRGESRRTAFLNTVSLTPFRVIDVEETEKKTWKTQLDFSDKDVMITRFGVKKDGSDLVSRRAIPVKTVETLSGLYYLRTRPFSLGETVKLNLMDNGRMYQVEVHLLRTEKVKTSLGKKESLVFSIEARRIGRRRAGRVAKAPVAKVSKSSLASASPGTIGSSPGVPTPAPKTVPKVKPADVTASLWLSNDAARIPVKFEMQLGKTTLSAEITDYAPAP